MSTCRISVGILVSLLSLVGLASPGRAISFEDEPSLPEIARLSTLAFRGEVVQIRHALTLAPKTRQNVPYTVYTFRVDRAYRGTRDGATVDIFEYGGPVNSGEWEGLLGVPEIRLGDRLAIFANDSFQFATASLYADMGMRRFVLHQGESIALTANWTILAEGSEESDLHQCQTDASAPGQCAAWLDGSGQVMSGPLPTGSTARLVSATAFDNQVASLLAGLTGASPAQQFDEAGFAAHLGAFIDAISQPARGN